MWILAVIIGVSVVVALSRAKAKKEDQVPAGRERVRVNCSDGRKVDTPEHREELIKWNARHPDTLYEGPINENLELRRLRLKLMTPEQLAKIPFWVRISARSGSYHRDFFADSYCCIICGDERRREQKWCSCCDERYKNDVANGWRPDPEDHIKEGYEWVLWRLQQIVAKDLQAKIISEATARAEMREVVEVARREIAEKEESKRAREASFQRQQEQQAELSDIVKRLS